MSGRSVIWLQTLRLVPGRMTAQLVQLAEALFALGRTAHVSRANRQSLEAGLARGVQLAGSSREVMLL